MPQHCVLATAVACDVLRECGMSAEPLSVRAIVANRRFVEGHREGLAAATIVATGGHILDDTRTDGTVTNKMWNGHLVAWIRDRACLVDLTLGARLIGRARRSRYTARVRVRVSPAEH